MGLRCLMGHDYGPLQTEREREDRGDEAVVTVREYKECSRCGHRRIVSENKEVTATGVDADASSRFERGASSEPDPEVSSGAAPTRSSELTTEYEDVTAEEDDGVILPDDDDDGEDEREPGDWPDHRDEEDADEDAEVEGDDDAEYDPWPDVAGGDEGYSAEPSDGGPAADVSFGSGLTPETTDSEEATGSGGGDAGAGSRGGGATTPTRRDRSPANTSDVGRAAVQHTATADATVVCPECDHAAPAEGSSLRPGDICPECRRGYLVERES